MIKLASHFGVKTLLMMSISWILLGLVVTQDGAFMLQVCQEHMALA
jgi:hypothetical protein